MIPVGATDINDNIAFFRDRAEMANRGVSAPGVGIYTTDLRAGYAYGDGTFRFSFLWPACGPGLFPKPHAGQRPSGDVKELGR